MSDVLSVELEVKDAGATVKFNNFQQSAERTVAGVNAAGTKIRFGEALAADVGRGIRSTDSAVSSLVTRMGQLAPSIAKAREEQDKLNRSAAALAIIQGRSPAAGANGLTPGQIAGRTNLARQGADVFTQAASGSPLSLIAIQQGPQIIDAMAQSGIKLSASLATMGPLIGIGAAAAAVAYKVTNDIRTEAERRLAVEEKIQGALNKQILVAKEYFEILKKGRQETADKQFLGQFAGGLGSNLADLEGRKQTYELLLSGAAKRASFDPESKKQADLLLQQIQLIDQQILSVKQLENASDAANRSFERGWERWKVEQEAAREAEERFKKSVEEGVQLAKEYGATWTNVFTDLSGRVNNDNPFYGFFSRQASEAEKLKEQLKGLPPELQKTALAMRAIADAKDLFGLKLDNALGANRLLQSAANFRNPFDPEKLKQQEESFIQRFLANNPNYLFLQGKTELDDATRKDILRRGNFDTPEQRFNKSLQDQFDTIYDSRRPDFDQAAADRRFISATQGVNPLDLDPRLRDAAATARENEAARMEGYEKQARDDRKTQIELLEAIATRTGALNNTAKKGGKEAVEISIKNESDSTVRFRRGTTDDVDREYEFTGFGISGGSNR